MQKRKHEKSTKRLITGEIKVEAAPMIANISKPQLEICQVIIGRSHYDSR